jgi:hypothetical protein
MENNSLFKNLSLKIPHLPTLLLIVGYPFFWLEMCFSAKRGIASSFATMVFGICFVWVISKNKGIISLLSNFKTTYLEQKKSTRFYICFCFVLIGLILSIGFYASMLPVHLVQEFDSLNYHITMPRQHLLLGSFMHIGWSPADLFVLPIDFGLAPYWLATAFPNKWPQFLFLLGLAGIVASLVKRFGGNYLGSCLALIAFFGMHFIGIQIGTAMLDIVLAYLFFASIDSLLDKKYILSGIEGAFYFWSKPFIPFQIVICFAAVFLAWILFKRVGFKIINPGFNEGFFSLKKFAIPFLVASFFVAGPFVLKSLYYASTPLYPFGAGKFNISHTEGSDSLCRKSMIENAKNLVSAKDSYGYGRGFIDFLRHFWLVAVPDKGVNNRYDYPIGLMYLIFLAPFVFLFGRLLKWRNFSVLGFFIVIYWVSWWLGSQQTRFLYIPVILIIIIVSSNIRTYSAPLMISTALALALTAFSVYNAHKNDFGKPRVAVLRAKDRQLLRINDDYESRKGEVVTLDYYDIAYARFPAKVIKPGTVWVLENCR